MKSVARVTCHFDIAIPQGGDSNKFAAELNEGLEAMQEAFPPEWGEIVGAKADETRPLSPTEIQEAGYEKQLTS